MQDERTHAHPLFAGPPKQCSKCGEVKPLTEYHAKWAEGRLFSHCKTCDRLKERRYKTAVENRGKVRAKRRRERAARLERNGPGDTALRRDHAKENARAAVHRALGAGTLHKPDRCERCGAMAEYGHDGRSLLHGHHPDYSKPLDVEWVCTFCHGRIHAEYGTGAAPAS